MLFLRFDASEPGWRRGKVRIRKEKLEIQQPTVREGEPPSGEGYGATSATRVKIGPIGRLSRLLHCHDTSGANFPLRVRHPRPVARATFT